MALEQRLQARLQQRLVMTPALQMAIKLLQLNRLDLEQTLRQEMVENPLLEEREEPLSSAEREERERAEADVEGDEKVIDNLDSDAFFAEYFDSQPTSANMREIGEAPPIENTLTSEETLVDHLVWQLEMGGLEGDDLDLCHAVLGNLDPDGYLRTTPAEITSMGPWSVLSVQRAIARIQDLDPSGVCASDLRECLFLQLEHLGLEDDLACRVVREHMDELKAHRYKDIARAVQVELSEVADAIAVIQGLNPRPGEVYSSERPQYIVPDVLVDKDDGEYVVMVDDDGLPKLRVSRLYRQMARGDHGLGKDASDYLQEKLRAALWLIKSFGQRQRTIRKVAESIVKHQVEFLDHGLTALRPMVLRDVAEDIGMHESTVSRVVNGKYMNTPQGIFEMKFFFHSGLGHASGSDVSSVSVKERIRKLVESENERKPLSDAALAAKLTEGGLHIARRTVAKYREEIGIPASKSRRAIG